jgi:phospholipid N-methyltransferase
MLAIATRSCQSLPPESALSHGVPDGALCLTNTSDFAIDRGETFGGRVARFFGQWGVFFRGFVEHPKMVGSIIPSSRFTIDKMLAPVKWDECQLFVEYGPGVGTFCRPVLERLRRDGTLIVIDTNPLYIDYLRKTIPDGRFHAVLGSAA